MAPKTVAVTGANGYLGGFIVADLLEHGHTVRAVVRDPNSSGCNFLKEMKGQERLTLCKGDLDKQGSYDEAFTGCDAVIHAAAVVKDDFKKDPWVEIIDPSIAGVRFLMESARKAGVKRIVATGSICSVEIPVSKGHPKNQSYTEDLDPTWLTPHKAPYSYSKLSSMKLMEKEWEGELATLMPSLMIGPVQNDRITSSQQTIRLVVNREMGVFAPPMWTDWCDVRDAAKAHRVAVETPTLKSKRYILSRNEVFQLSQVGKIVNELFPGSFNAASKNMPWGLLWTVSWFDKRISSYFLYAACAKKPGFDGSKIEREMDGFTYEHTNFRDTVKMNVEKLVELGVATDRKKKK